MALHGGISPDLNTFKDLYKIEWFREPPKSGLFCDILWSDPLDNPNGQLNTNFTFNE